MDKKKKTKLALLKKGKQTDTATQTLTLCSVTDTLNETSEFRSPISSVRIRQDSRRTKIKNKDNSLPKGSTTKEVESEDDGATKSEKSAHIDRSESHKTDKFISANDERLVTSTERIEDEGKCPLCFTTVNKAELQVHFQQCLQGRFKHTSSLDTCTKSDNKLSEECFFCQFCHKDLSKFNSTRKTQHLNRCMDKVQRDSKDEGTTTNSKNSDILECPICGKKLKTAQARRVHMKKCAATYNVSTEQVIKLAKKQEEEKNVLAALNEPSDSDRPTSAKVSRNQNRKRIKEPRGKFEEEMQIAMAISSSLADTRLEVLPQKLMQESGPSKKRGKKDKFKTDPILLLLSDQQKHARTENSVSCLLLSQEKKDESPRKEQTLSFFKSSLGIQETVPSLWQKGSHQHDALEENDKIIYYVGSLMPPLEPSTVVTGSKLRRMSQIPGRGRQSSVHTEKDRTQVNQSNEDEVTGNHGDDPLVVSTQTVVDLAELMEDEISQGDTTQNVGVSVGGFYQEKADQLQASVTTRATNSLKKHYASLLNNPEHSDVSIMTKDGIVKAHKLILYTRCPVLYKMMCGDRIPLENETSDTVKAVLSYIYTADFGILPSLVQDVRALSLRLKLEELTKACDILIPSVKEVELQTDSDEEERKTKEIRNFENVFGNDSEEEQTRAEEELVMEADEISEDDYFDIMLTQREKLRKLSDRSEQTLVGKVGHVGAVRTKSSFKIGDATQREISLFFRNGSNSESSSDEDVSEPKRPKSDEPDLLGSQKSLNSIKEGNSKLNLCINLVGSSRNSQLNLDENVAEKSEHDGVSCNEVLGNNCDKVKEDESMNGPSPHKSKKIRSTSITGNEPCHVSTKPIPSTCVSSDIHVIEIGSSGDSNSVDEITRPIEAEMNLSVNYEKNEMSQGSKGDDGNTCMSVGEVKKQENTTRPTNNRDLHSPYVDMDISGADLFGSPSPAASNSSHRSSPVAFLGKEGTNLSPHKPSRSSNPSSPEQVMEILSSPEIVTEIQSIPNFAPSSSFSKEIMDDCDMNLSYVSDKREKSHVFNRKTSINNSYDGDHLQSEVDPINCDMDPCDKSIQPIRNRSLSPSIDKDRIKSPEECITNNSPKFKPREGKRFRFQRKILITAEDNKEDEAYCSQILDQPVMQDSGKDLVMNMENDILKDGNKNSFSKGKDPGPASTITLSPVYQPQTSRQEEGEDCRRTCRSELGELSLLEEDVWENFEDNGGMEDVVIMDSPEKVEKSPTVSLQHTETSPVENFNDGCDLPDIPEAEDMEEFSDSFVLPGNDDIAMDMEDNSSEIKKNFKTPVSIRGGIQRRRGIQKEPSKVWVPPSPFTPMPDYDRMATPILKKEVQRYGVKPIAKKKMIVVLKDIYRKMHEYETDSELDMSKDSVDDDRTSNKKPTGDVSEDENEDVNCSQASTNSSASDLIEESFMQTEETDITASQQLKGDLKEKFMDFLEKRNDIHTRILKYEPLELDWLKKELTDAGIKTSMDKLMNFLDEKCITFTMKNRRNNSPRKRKRRKKKEESNDK